MQGAWLFLIVLVLTNRSLLLDVDKVEVIVQRNNGMDILSHTSNITSTVLSCGSMLWKYAVEVCPVGPRIGCSSFMSALGFRDYILRLLSPIALCLLRNCEIVLVYHSLPRDSSCCCQCTVVLFITGPFCSSLPALLYLCFSCTVPLVFCFDVINGLLHSVNQGIQSCVRQSC